jgi:hypothetical protein
MNPFSSWPGIAVEDGRRRPDDPRIHLFEKGWIAGSIGERSDAVLRTAMLGNDSSRFREKRSR